jgi:hypothetical protein
MIDIPSQIGHKKYYKIKKFSLSGESSYFVTIENPRCSGDVDLKQTITSRTSTSVIKILLGEE